MEGSGLVGQDDEDTIVNVGVESWSRLEPAVCEKILEKLPYTDRLRLRVVCKDWKRSALERVERKPYFEIVVQERLNGLVVYDVVSKSLSFEQLPFENHGVLFEPWNLIRFAVEGLIFTNQPKAADMKLALELVNHDHLHDPGQWCVYSIHTRTMHVLPRAPGSGSTSRRYFCGMMVDTSIKPHHFKLVVSYSDGAESQIYDSASRSWSLHPNSNPNSNSSLLLEKNEHHWYLRLCHKDCMYMSTGSGREIEDILVYSMKEDRWSTLSGSPFRHGNRTRWGGRGSDGILHETRPYLGAWDDRIFAVVHDSEAESVTVWELIDVLQQEWVEYARCSKEMYEQLMFDNKFFGRSNWEIVSVFSEEYVLMYEWHLNRSDGLMLFNLKTKEWEPVACSPITHFNLMTKEWKPIGCNSSPIMFEDDEESDEESDDSDYGPDQGGWY